MTKMLFLSAAFFISIVHAIAQSPAERQNRTVLNRIEYFFNTQQTDSVYALASDDFKKQISSSQFELALTYFYQYGKIKNITPATFVNNVAGYNLTLDRGHSSLYLGVDSTYKFHYFTIKNELIPTETREVIQSNVKPTDVIDMKIDSLALGFLKRNNTPGMAIGLIHNNRINEFYYGHTIKGDDKSIPTGSTLFEIGSLTKIFTSILLADLAQKDSLDLEDSIIKYLPDSLAKNIALHGITLKTLANHTSGLPRLPTNIEESLNFNPANPYKTYNLKELYTYLKDVEPLYQPGENYEYSNLGFAILGDIIARKSGKTIPTLIKEVITTPLGMLSTTDKVDPKKQQISKAYDIQGKEVPTWEWQAFFPAGGLKSTITDMLRFAQYQFKMPESDLENAMATTRLFTHYLPPTTDIGLAWHMTMVNDVIQYWHNGATGGHSAFIGLIPDKRSAIVILSNSAHSLDEFAMQVLSRINQVQ